MSIRSEDALKSRQFAVLHELLLAFKSSSDVVWSQEVVAGHQRQALHNRFHEVQGAFRLLSLSNCTDELPMTIRNLYDQQQREYDLRWRGLYTGGN